MFSQLLGRRFKRCEEGGRIFFSSASFPHIFADAAVSGHSTRYISIGNTRLSSSLKGCGIFEQTLKCMEVSFGGFAHKYCRSNM